MEKYNAETLAQLFHETYERLAPEFGYKTREESARPWISVPDENQQLMVAVSRHVLDKLKSTEPVVPLSEVLELVGLIPNITKGTRFYDRLQKLKQKYGVSE